ncbi:GSCOCG00012402001-RA-CDS, partial [Cotesia congregata]
MDIQFITEEYSCAQYVAEYVNKTNRGISNLQREIIKCIDEHPEFDVVEITRKLGVEMLNSVEISNQEAAWYLLREPMSKSSSVIVYIPTMWPGERQKLKKTTKELDEMGIDDDSTDIWKENWFTKYEKRPEELSNVTLAQFVAHYNVHNDGNSTKRKTPRMLRYCNYDMSQNLTYYKREMVTLHIPFRNENEEILAKMKFTEIYTSNENLILQRRQEFESNLDIQKTIEICRDLCREDRIYENDEPEENIIAEQNPFQHLYNNPNAIVNDDIRLATLHKLGLIAKRRENLMANDDFYNLMRMANEKQKRLLLHVIFHLLSPDDVPFQIFCTGPAGCGKTFVIKLLMEIYNRYTDNDGYCNAYITCASTGKAAVVIEGTTVHTALKISLSRLLPLRNETPQQYRTLFKYVKVIIIDEISMISAQLLIKIDCRLRLITGNFQTNFGGLDIIFIGDLRQLPPVRATPIYKQHKQPIVGPILWQNLKFYKLDQVMRQANQQFSSILTKIGNGERLDEIEIALIESRFYSVEEATTKCPQGIRLFNTNHAVTKYN